ncbi:PREDICTED: UPF0489 protein C5orf22 homolog isoform X2 [Amphimedon queenslandica]|uniref:Uncharacterized protein n=1 Tax=Amphimedon queenslandica TaxID=400682 RepID=A0AAN0IZJ7_AMPQE|nr:PREDICTED: UPF0489 protein C5orf22 homolog isoform X2 [Amphimedon queenslandica]|eukprot:XP_019849876.1 PREDICTED: UPF0489 protein C5orf22 homolog isoform X2 [Amphimedon queenslandica]
MAAHTSSVETSLAIHIVEDHNEVLEYIYSDIGKKILPFTGICLVHFDSHPDLLAPQDMPADRVYDKENLFESLSIGDWILPAVYAGHFTSIVWIKPPWSNQIPTGQHMLSVGKHCQCGYLRVHLPIAYYLSEGLYACLDQLENVKTVPLYVLTLDLKEHIDTISDPCITIQKLLEESSACILDVDLDFFSTVNPFKLMFTEEQYEYLSHLYGFELSKANEDDPSEVNESRLCKLSSLLDLWSGKLADKNLIETQIKSLIGQEKNGDIIEADDVGWLMAEFPLQSMLNTHSWYDDRSTTSCQ